MRQRIVELFATGLYLGKIKVAPGTFGTFLGIPLAWALTTWLPRLGYPVALLVIFAFSAWMAHLHERYTGQHDPGEIVIDEVAGFAVAMMWLPLTWQSFTAAFVLFRLLDITKPPPIRQIDEGIGGGIGTTLDDMLSGLVANGVLQYVASATDWLGGAAHGA